VDFTVAFSLPPLAQAALAQSPLLRCDACKKVFKSNETLAAHFDSAKHRRREAELQKLSPAKRSSPARNNLASLEQQATTLQGARAAQAFFDVGTQHAQHGDASAASRCLQRCLALLPALSESSGVSRVMIEVRCRTLLARMAWSSESQQALAQLDRTLSLFHKSGQSPLRLIEENSPFSSLSAAASSWMNALRHSELEAHFVPLAREFGARLSAQTPHWAAAALLVCGRHFDFAAAVFDALRLFGHAAECLWLHQDLAACIQSCIVHSNVVLLDKCAAASSHPVLLQLAQAFRRWDLVALDALIFSPKLLDSERELVKLALAVLSKP